MPLFCGFPHPIAVLKKMSPARRFAATLFPSLLLTALLPPMRGEAQEPAAPPVQILLREGLALARPGRPWTRALRSDVVEAQIVSGNWTPPKDGDVVGPADGQRIWRSIRAADDGVFQDGALAGGYLCCNVDVDAQAVWLLEAAGHAMVYVNGQPRGGDPYSHGYVRLPVLLRPGTNEFLFQVARGRLTAKLTQPRSPIHFDLADSTLPDALVGQPLDAWAAVQVVNCSGEALDDLVVESAPADAEWLATEVGPVLPMTVRKAGFRLQGPAPQAEGEMEIRLQVRRKGEEQVLDRATIRIRAAAPERTHKRTFVSSIDGSVQYFAVVPAIARPGQPPPGLILTLHGAGVEAIGQANAYLAKDWAHVVAPTNRRPFGFDWEDWGRLDALEVLAIAQKEPGVDAQRTFLTGHSMGGHGAWQLAVHYPDRFLAVGPSAGWVSFFSYGPGRRSEAEDPIAQLLQRTTSPSDTLALVQNLAGMGVYVLHGQADDNVPVTEARTMKTALEAFHKDFSYHEEPGMGHWWGKEGVPGTACVDWPPMWELFQRQSRPARVEDVEFLTSSPAVSSTAHWATIEAQQKQHALSSIRLKYDAQANRITGATANVHRLSIDPTQLPPSEKLELALDDQPPIVVDRRDAGPRLWFTNTRGVWSSEGAPSPSQKSPRRYGPFKEAFANRMLFVYGTSGTDEENAWALDKARFDAETFWYRGNGSVDVVSDRKLLETMEQNPTARQERNVILYGNRDSNAAWTKLLGECPVEVTRGGVRAADRQLTGDDLACLFVWPRAGEDSSLVGVVSGSGIAGMRLTDRLPFFASGAGYPDFMLIGPQVHSQGLEGVRGAGFFGVDWSVERGEFYWR